MIFFVLFIGACFDLAVGGTALGGIALGIVSSPTVGGRGVGDRSVSGSRSSRISSPVERRVRLSVYSGIGIALLFSRQLSGTRIGTPTLADPLVGVA